MHNTIALDFLNGEKEYGMGNIKINKGCFGAFQLFTKKFDGKMR